MNKFILPSWQNVILLTYITLAYCCGMFVITSSSAGVLATVLGILALSHSQFLSAYLIHDCIHGLVFPVIKFNEVLGDVLLWITGACYSKFMSMKQMHLLHHQQKADTTTFDYRTSVN